MDLTSLAVSDLLFLDKGLLFGSTFSLSCLELFALGDDLLYGSVPLKALGALVRRAALSMIRLIKNQLMFAHCKSNTQPRNSRMFTSNMPA